MFSAEDPSLYRQAFAHNRPFAQAGPYQTTLAPQDEVRYEEWRSSLAPDIRPPLHGKTDYDYRGYFQAMGGASHAAGEHFPDTFKTPYDTTFSRESKYATRDNPFVWQGDRLVDRRTGRVIF